MAYNKEKKQEIFNSICELIANGMSLRKAQSFTGVNHKSVWDNLVRIESNNTQYARACEERAIAIFEEALEIADKQDLDVITNEDGITTVNHNVINRSRLQVDTRKWFLSKLMPKKFGDKLDITSDNEKIQTTPIIVATPELKENIENELDRLNDSRD